MEPPKRRLSLPIISVETLETFIKRDDLTCKGKDMIPKSDFFSEKNWADEPTGFMSF